MDRIGKKRCQDAKCHRKKGRGIDFLVTLLGVLWLIGTYPFVSTCCLGETPQEHIALFLTLVSHTRRANTAGRAEADASCLDSWHRVEVTRWPCYQHQSTRSTKNLESRLGDWVIWIVWACHSRLNAVMIHSWVDLTPSSAVRSLWRANTTPPSIIDDLIGPFVIHDTVRTNPTRSLLLITKCQLYISDIDS